MAHTLYHALSIDNTFDMIKHIRFDCNPLVFTSRLTEYLIATLLPNLYREKWYNKAKLSSSGEFKLILGSFTFDM